MHVSALGLSCETPAPPTRKHPERDKKSEHGSGRGKKARIFGPPTLPGLTLRGPTVRGPHPSRPQFSGFGWPTLRAPTFGAPFVWVWRPGPYSSGPHFSGFWGPEGFVLLFFSSFYFFVTKKAKKTETPIWAKVGLFFLGQSRIGQSRSNEDGQSRFDQSRYQPGIWHHKIDRIGHDPCCRR